MNYDILEAILKIVAIILTGILIPYIKSKLTEEQQNKIRTTVEVAVKAAEMIYSETGMGADKKAWVMSQVTSKLKITNDEANQLIEAFVYEMNKNTVGIK